MQIRYIARLVREHACELSSVVDDFADTHACAGGYRIGVVGVVTVSLVDVVSALVVWIGDGAGHCIGVLDGGHGGGNREERVALRDPGIRAW